MILVLNAGSSSVKFAVYADDAAEPPVARGSVSGSPPVLRVAFAESRPAIDERGDDDVHDAEAAAHWIFMALRASGLLDRIAAVGHRIVHGGQGFVDPVRLDSVTLPALQRLVPLDPLHQPLGLAVVDAASEALPDAVQIGCFDTAFHAGQPRLARLYGLPHSLADEGVVAYGFHGLSYAHVASVLRERHGETAGGRVIAAHLGSGVSLCALLDGRSVATTMGFSVLDGPPMSTRSGSIDPGVILYLIRERGMSAEAVTDLLYHRSGWLGVSGISGEMTTLLRSEDERAREAVELFAYRVGREIGSLAAALGGLDRIVFTGGIGEHAPAVRARICDHAAWLGVTLDAARNDDEQHAATADEGPGAARAIGADDSRVELLVIPADEERVIAGGVRAWLASPAAWHPAGAAFGEDVERLQGRGVVRRGKEIVGEVEYDLTITPPQLRGTGVTFEAGLPDRTPKMAPDIAGRLMGPLFQAQTFAEHVHTLVLEDGRAFDFRVLQPDTNEIVGVSWFHPTGATRLDR